MATIHMIPRRHGDPARVLWGRWLPQAAGANGSVSRPSRTRMSYLSWPAKTGAPEPQLAWYNTTAEPFAGQLEYL